MDITLALAGKIEALESIIAHLPNNCQNRREYYQEKCDSYRHISGDPGGDCHRPKTNIRMSDDRIGRNSEF